MQFQMGISFAFRSRVEIKYISFASCAVHTQVPLEVHTKCRAARGHCEIANCAKVRAFCVHKQRNEKNKIK